jgi:rhodanese-related sulfurtransferase
MEWIEAKKWSDSSESILIDVRTPLEFSSVRAKSAVNLPLDQLTVDKVKGYDKNKVGLICQSGTRAKMAAEKLVDSGLDLYVIEGGTQSWVQQSLPFIQGLERQVRIVAGALVLIGVTLSLTIFPAAIYLSGFVGAGLVFAGVTDTCAMGMILAKMPWNNKSVSCSTGG